MRRFIVGLTVLFLVQSNFSAHKGQFFELRAVYEKAAESSTPMEWKSGQRSEILHVGKNVLLDGSVVKSAAVSKDLISGEPLVLVVFNDEGTKKFSDITAQNVGKRIAVLVNGKVYTAPRINERISGGRAQIQGKLTTEEAEKLAEIINGAVEKKGAE